MKKVWRLKEDIGPIKKGTEGVLHGTMEYWVNIGKSKAVLMSKGLFEQTEEFEVGDMVMFRTGPVIIHKVIAACSGEYTIETILGTYQAKNDELLLHTEPKEDGQGSVVIKTNFHSNVFNSILMCDKIKPKKKRKALKLIEALEKDNSLAYRSGDLPTDLNLNLIYAFIWTTYGPSRKFWKNISNLIESEA